MRLLTPNKKITISAFVILAAVVITFLQVPQNGQVSQPLPTQPNDVDYYMKDYSIISNDSEGIAQYWFGGNEMNHYIDGTTHIAEPKITLRNEKQQIWTTNATQAHVAGNDQITLDGSVQIQQVNINHRPITINTDKLEVSLQNKTAKSDELVSIKTNEGTLTAKGMILDFANNTVKLLSNVNADYVAR